MAPLPAEDVDNLWICLLAIQSTFVLLLVSLILGLADIKQVAILILQLLLLLLAYCYICLCLSSFDPSSSVATSKSVMLVWS